MRPLPFRLPMAVFALLLPALPIFAVPTPATILIGGRVVPFQVKPYLGPNGEVMAPVDAVQLMGAKFQPNAGGTVTITASNGKQITSPYEPTGGRYCVPFQKVATALGGMTDWQPTTNTLTVRARLQLVRQNFNQLTIYTSYPVYYSVRRIAGPERLYVDLYGLDLGTAPANVPSSSGNVTQIRSGQISDQTVRITIDMKQSMPFQVLSGMETDQVKVALSGLGSPVQTAQAMPPPPHVVVSPPLPHLPQSAGPVTIENVGYKVVSPTLTQITVTASGAAKYRTEALNNPNRLAFDLAGAVLDSDLQTEQDVDNPVVKSIRVGRLLTEQTKFGRVVLDLSRMVGFSVDSRPADGGMAYVINVITTDPSAPIANVPSVAPVQPYIPSVPTNTSLAGKIIVVDPGHGGRDTGASAELRPYDVYEKDITLAIGRRVQNVLTQAGAIVLMTRTDDSFPALESRPLLANNRHADYFISIHADSSVLGRNTLAGTTVYFHGQSPLCRLMAADIGRRVSEVSGISYNGVKSDTIRFRTGFAVLRGSYMPAVLVETGYMNNDKDLSKLRDDASQQKIAEGITAGLRDFIADQVRLLRSAQTIPSGTASDTGSLR
ncbi:MAG: N-acetylmuramoyl-L-alanine amidase [Janthinobacterium lividum]